MVGFNPVRLAHEAEVEKIYIPLWSDSIVDAVV